MPNQKSLLRQMDPSVVTAHKSYVEIGTGIVLLLALIVAIIIASIKDHSVNAAKETAAEAVTSKEPEPSAEIANAAFADGKGGKYAVTSNQAVTFFTWFAFAPGGVFFRNPALIITRKYAAAFLATALVEIFLLVYYLMEDVAVPGLMLLWPLLFLPFFCITVILTTAKYDISSAAPGAGVTKTLLAWIVCMLQLAGAVFIFHRTVGLSTKNSYYNWAKFLYSASFGLTLVYALVWSKYSTDGSGSKAPNGDDSNRLKNKTYELIFSGEFYAVLTIWDVCIWLGTLLWFTLWQLDTLIDKKDAFDNVAKPVLVFFIPLIFHMIQNMIGLITMNKRESHVLTTVYNILLSLLCGVVLVFLHMRMCAIPSRVDPTGHVDCTAMSKNDGKDVWMLFSPMLALWFLLFIGVVHSSFAPQFAYMLDHLSGGKVDRGTLYDGGGYSQPGDEGRTELNMYPDEDPKFL